MRNSEFYAIAKAIANKYLIDNYFMSWDEFADTNSLWDYPDEEVDPKLQKDAIIEACEDRVMKDAGE